MATRPLVDRFWEKVNTNGPTVHPSLGACWLWTAATNTGGYGKLAVDGRRAVKRFEDAHRISWRLHHGPIPPDRFVLHHCDTRACVRPSHLWLGTTTDNMRDCRAKGRFKHRGEQCPHGHPFTPENTYINTHGRWVCRTCGRLATKAYEMKQRALHHRTG